MQEEKIRENKEPQTEIKYVREDKGSKEKRREEKKR